MAKESNFSNLFYELKLGESATMTAEKNDCCLGALTVLVKTMCYIDYESFSLDITVLVDS